MSGRAVFKNGPVACDYGEIVLTRGGDEYPIHRIPVQWLGKVSGADQDSGCRSMDHYIAGRHEILKPWQRIFRGR